MVVLISIGIVLIILGMIFKVIHGIAGKKSGGEDAGKKVIGFLGMQLLLAGTMTAAIGIFYRLHFDVLAIFLGTLLFVQLFYSVLQGINIKSQPESHTLQTGFSWLGIFTVPVLVVAMVFYFLSDPDIIMKNNKFEVRGADGIKVHLDEFKAITIENFIPKIVDLYDGVHLGDTYRGKFELYRTGTSQLYVDRMKSPYIFIFLKSNIGIVITRDNPEETRKLYDEIKNYWNHYLQTDVLKRLKKQYVK